MPWSARPLNLGRLFYVLASALPATLDDDGGLLSTGGLIRQRSRGGEMGRSGSALAMQLGMDHHHDRPQPAVHPRPGSRTQVVEL